MDLGPGVGLRRYSSFNPLGNMEDPKNTKDDKKEKVSPELKEELTEEEVKSVDGGTGQWTTLTNGDH